MKMSVVLPILVAMGAGTACHKRMPAKGTASVTASAQGAFQVDYDRAVLGGYSIQVESKCVDQKMEGPGDGAPEHIRFQFGYPHPVWKGVFQENFKCIRLIPLHDRSVLSFSQSYGRLFNVVSNLRMIIQQRPAAFTLRKGIPVWDYTDVEQTLHSKVTYLDTAWQSGFYFLDHPNVDSPSKPLNNGEMSLIYQGISSDGNWYIYAQFVLYHPGLPTGDISSIPVFDDERHLIASEKWLNARSDSEFSPSIQAIRNLIMSIRPK